MLKKLKNIKIKGGFTPKYNKLMKTWLFVECHSSFYIYFQRQTF